MFVVWIISGSKSFRSWLVSLGEKITQCWQQLYPWQKNRSTSGTVWSCLAHFVCLCEQCVCVTGSVEGPHTTESRIDAAEAFCKHDLCLKPVLDDSLLFWVGFPFFNVSIKYQAPSKKVFQCLTASQSRFWSPDLSSNVESKRARGFN